MIPLLCCFSWFGLARAEVITEIGPEIELRSAGAWIRALPMEDRWMGGYSGSGEFWVAPLNQTADGWELDKSQQIQVTESGGILKDHAIRRCADGGYLHAGSANVDSDNDSAYAARMSSDFTVLARGVVEEREPGRAHNDLTALCADEAEGVIFPEFNGGNTFFHVGDDANASGSLSVQGAPRMSGGALHAEDGVITAIGADEGQLLKIATFDSDWNQLGSAQVAVFEPPTVAFWPQGLLHVGEHWIVALMGFDYQGDDWGNVYVLVLDEDWNLVERHQLTDYGQGEGGMRPWIAQRSEQLIVTWDHQSEQTLMALSLDPNSVGTTTGGASSGGTGSGGGIGDGDGLWGGGADTGDDDDDGCRGCAASLEASPVAPAWALLIALAIRRRTGLS